MQLRTVRAKLGVGFAIGPLVLILVGWTTYSNTQALGEARDAREHAADIVAAGVQLTADLLAAETDARGYFIAGTDNFLAGYRAAARTVDDDLGTLATLSRGVPELDGPVRQLTAMVRDKMGRLAGNVALSGEQGLTALVPIVVSNKGQDLTNQIRTVLDQMRDREEAVREAAAARATLAARSTSDWITYGTLITVTVLAGFGLLFTRAITRPVKSMVDALSSASAEILAGTTQQAAGMRQQSAAVMETVSTVNEVLQTTEQAAQRAQAVSQSSHRAAEAGEAGRAALDQSVEAMNRVRERTFSVAEGIVALAGQAQSIGDIVATVNDIADQINLLALNAAIEAARAGEHGLGFNVVAGAIKALAEQSKHATAQVRQILGEIERATHGAVMVAEQGTKSVADALETITQAGTTIRTLADVVADAAAAAAQISVSAGQQTTGMRQIHQAMASINQASAQNLAATTQSEQAIRHLTQLGGGLRALVA